MENYGRARQVTHDNIMRRMRYACWINKATDTHSKVIFAALPRQNWLLERTSVFVFTNIASVICIPTPAYRLWEPPASFSVSTGGFFLGW